MQRYQTFKHHPKILVSFASRDFRYLSKILSYLVVWMVVIGLLLFQGMQPTILCSWYANISIFLRLILFVKFHKVYWLLIYTLNSLKKFILSFRVRTRKNLHNWIFKLVLVMSLSMHCKFCQSIFFCHWCQIFCCFLTDNQLDGKQVAAN